jgi:hypothetical protein
MGNGGTPTGSINFQDNGVAISGCASAAVSNGQATCTTTALVAGSHAIKGLYSGDSVYGAGVAGPITQTVNPKNGVMIVSSNTTTLVGQSVTFTVTLVGNGMLSGNVKFLDNGQTVPNCGSVPMMNGVARCTTNRLVRGSHQIKGNYSGNTTNPAAVAGPITQTVQ